MSTLLAGATTYDPVTMDDLHTGDITSQPFTVVAGTYKRGDVLGGTGEVLAIVAAAADATAIMPFDVTLAADQELAVYVAGTFNTNKLNFNGQDTVAVKVALRNRGIHIRPFGAAN